MAERILNVESLQQRVLTTAEWAVSEIIVKDKNLAFEKLEDGSYKFKMGNGVDSWNDLPYIGEGTDVEEIEGIVEELIEGLATSDDLTAVSDEIKELKTSLTGGVILKGRVETIAELQAIENPQDGWAYFVGLQTATNLPEYVWFESLGRWELLGTFNTTALDDVVKTTDTITIIID